MSTQLRLEVEPDSRTGCHRPYPCDCRRCRPETKKHGWLWWLLVGVIL